MSSTTFPRYRHLTDSDVSSPAVKYPEKLRASRYILAKVVPRVFETALNNPTSALRRFGDVNPFTRAEKKERNKEANLFRISSGVLLFNFGKDVSGSSDGISESMLKASKC
jgi:hypothetical protein